MHIYFCYMNLSQLSRVAQIEKYFYFYFKSYVFKSIKLMPENEKIKKINTMFIYAAFILMKIVFII